MKIIYSGIIFIFLFPLLVSGSTASWNSGTEQPHISIFDQDSSQECIECHLEEVIDDHYHISHSNVNLSCITCHPGSEIEEHEKLEEVDCAGCHQPHDAKPAKDVHLTISCKACHLTDIPPADEKNCKACHNIGNTLGAASMVLPAKSIICIPCHTATFSVNDATTIITLLLFTAGVFCICAVWFSGKVVKGNIHISFQIFPVIKALILDILLQRRLFIISRFRWMIHALIFYSFFIRFIWGFSALICSLWLPEWEGTWIMMNKNHPATAFIFDFTGLLIIVGVLGKIIQKIKKQSNHQFDNMPGADWIGFTLLSSIVLVGFILEGMRIAMTKSPDGTSFAFIGYGISYFFSNFNITNYYGYVWYAHAVLTGMFVVYLPFSRMFHMIITPMVFLMNATTGHHNKKEMYLWK